MKRALPKRDSEAAQIAPYDRPLGEQRDQVGRVGRECVFRVSRSCGRVWGRGSQVSRLKDEGRPNSCPNIESGKGLVAATMAPEIDVSKDYALAEAALKSGVFASQDSVEAECELLLGKRGGRIVLEWKMSSQRS